MNPRFPRNDSGELRLAVKLLPVFYARLKLGSWTVTVVPLAAQKEVTGSTPPKGDSRTCKLRHLGKVSQYWYIAYARRVLYSMPMGVVRMCTDIQDPHQGASSSLLGIMHVPCRITVITIIAQVEHIFTGFPSMPYVSFVAPNATVSGHRSPQLTHPHLHNHVAKPRRGTHAYKHRPGKCRLFSSSLFPCDKILP